MDGETAQDWRAYVFISSMIEHYDLDLDSPR